MPTLSDKVPTALRSRFTEIVAITDKVCDEHLNDEYKELCREMAVIVCQKDAPAVRGKAASWAAAIVHSVGWVNFLSDPSQKPHIRTDDLARAIGVSPATMATKARVIRGALDLSPMDPRWCLESRLEDNPLVWMMQDHRSGMMFDIRQAPRNVQEEAYAKGLIPWIPADRSASEGGGE